MLVRVLVMGVIMHLPSGGSMNGPHPEAAGLEGDRGGGETDEKNQFLDHPTSSQKSLIGSI